MKFSDLFKKKDLKLAKVSAKNLSVKIDKKQLEKLTGGVDLDGIRKEPILGKAEYTIS